MGSRPRPRPGIGSSGAMRSSVPGPGSIWGTATAAAPSSPGSSKTISSSILSDIAWRSNTKLIARPLPACRRHHNRRSFGTTSSSRTTARHPMVTGRTCWSEVSPILVPARKTSTKSTVICLCTTRGRRSSRARAASAFTTISSSAGKAAGAVFRDHDLPLKLAHVFNNTIYSPQIGIKFSSPARQGHAVLGNLIFAETPITGLDIPATDNLVARPADARNYVRAPLPQLGALDFYPLPGRAKGSPLDLSGFAGELDFDRDFNGRSKDGHYFRGAYAGDGSNPGWRLRAEIKSNK